MFLNDLLLNSSIIVMQSNFNKIQSFFSTKRIIIPIVLGFIVAVYLLFKDFKPESLHLISLNWQFFGFLGLALFFVFLRDFAYIIRLRFLTDKKISWKGAFQVVMLWEFASSLTPSVVGGSAIAMFIINQERVSLGRSTAIVMITAIFDELFYIVTVPVVFILVGFNSIFVNGSFSLMGSELSTGSMFLIGYLFILGLVLLLVYGVFINPYQTRYIIVSIFRIRFLRRWKFKAIRTGNEIIIASKEFKGKSFLYWLKLFGITTASWTSRFLVVNCLIAAVAFGGDQLLIYARQLVMWVILLISPTPGGTGIAEFFFPVFLKEFIPDGLASVLALLWRFLTYYPYILIGVIVLPLWMKRIIKKNKS